MQRNGSKATYSSLIMVFERAGYQNYADLVRRIVDLCDNDRDDYRGSGEEQCQPETYPQYKQQQARSKLPQATPEICYIMVEDEQNLPKGMHSFSLTIFGDFSVQYNQHHV